MTDTPQDPKPTAAVEAAAKPGLAVEPALALLEFESIAAGIQAADLMVKRAELDSIYAGTVQPGRLLVLIGGPVAEVEEALKAGLASAPDVLRDHIFLPGVHRDVVRALGGSRSPEQLASGHEAVGIIETGTVPAAIHAADKGIKGAEVTLMEIRLADGLGGKGIVIFTGTVADVEAAVEIADEALQASQKVRHVVISQMHAELAAVLRGSTRFGRQLDWPL